MNETTKNFLEVFTNLEPWQPPKVFWRLYYDDNGHPLFYTQEEHQGNYIDVTPEQYQRASLRVKVINHKLVELTTNRIKKLTQHEIGTPCYPTDVSIVVSSDDPHQCWKFK